MKLLLLFSLVWLPSAFATPKKPARDFLLYAKGPEFDVDKGLVDKVYNESLAQSRSVPTLKRVGEFLPEFGLFFPQEAVLKNQYYSVDHTEKKSPIPRADLNLGTQLLSFADTNLYAHAKAGFFYREGITNVKSTSTEQSAKDAITLTGMPLVGYARLEYAPSFLSNAKPSLLVGSGTYWVQQSGSLDGLQQAFWIPVILMGAQVVFFDQSHQNDEHFGGLTLSATYEKSFNSSQTLRGWMFGIGTRFMILI